MFKKALLVAGLASVAMFSVGCGGDPCLDSADAAIKKYESCEGMETQAEFAKLGKAAWEASNAECTDEMAKNAECSSKCYDGSCEDLAACLEKC